MALTKGPSAGGLSPSQDPVDGQQYDSCDGGGAVTGDVEEGEAGDGHYGQQDTWPSGRLSTGLEAAEQRNDADQECGKQCVPKRSSEPPRSRSKAGSRTQAEGDDDDRRNDQCSEVPD